MKSKISIETSQSGHQVVVIDGVEIHSMYNPVKEANEFVYKHANLLDSKSNILILGLGLGYHVQKIYDRMKQTHKTFSISVIEPDERLITFQEKIIPLDLNHINIFSGGSVDDLFHNYKFVSFLNERPSIIAFVASFNMHRKFFEQFLTYSASRKLSSVVRCIEDQDFKDYLSFHDLEITIDDILIQVNAKDEINKNDIKLLAFKEIYDNCLTEVETKISQTKEGQFINN